MLRKALTILSLLGLLLSAGAWLSNYWYHVSWSSNNGRYYVASKDSGLCIEHITQDDFDGSRSNHGFFIVTGFYGWRTSWLPSYYEDSATSPSYERWEVPWWMFVGAFSLVFLFSNLPARRRRKRKKLGLCVKCGYDLRGSKDICPECGQEFETT